MFRTSGHLSAADDDDDLCPFCGGSFAEAVLDGRTVEGCCCDLRESDTLNLEHQLQSEVRP